MNMKMSMRRGYHKTRGEIELTLRTISSNAKPVEKRVRLHPTVLQTAFNRLAYLVFFSSNALYKHET